MTARPNRSLPVAPRRHRLLRRRPLLLGCAVAAVVAAVPVAGPAVGAANASATVCEWSDVGTLEPPIALRPVTSYYSTNGETGTIECDGPILDRMPSGPGTIGFEARLGPTKKVTCTSGGTGDYTGFFSFPTADGSRIHGVDYGNFNFGVLRNGAVFGGEYRGVLFKGTFDASIVDGTCVTGVRKVSFHTADAGVAKKPRKVTMPGDV